MEKLTREVMCRILLLSCPLLLPPPPHLFGTWECWPRVQPGDPSRSPQLHLEDDGGRWERGMLQRRGSCSQTCVLRLWCPTTVKNSLQIITCTKALHHPFIAVWKVMEAFGGNDWKTLASTPETVSCHGLCDHCVARSAVRQVHDVFR